MTAAATLLGLASAADPLPPADDRLYGPQAFGAGWLVVGIAAVLLALAALVWAVRPARRTAPVAPASAVDLNTAYLRRLDELEQQLSARRLTHRALHHELSRTLRRLASDAGTRGATAMSVRALDASGQPQVAAAVRSYEHPQFEPLPDGDPYVALGRARRVVDETTAARRGGQDVSW